MVLLYFSRNSLSSTVEHILNQITRLMSYLSINRFSYLHDHTFFYELPVLLIIKSHTFYIYLFSFYVQSSVWAFNNCTYNNCTCGAYWYSKLCVNIIIKTIHTLSHLNRWISQTKFDK